MSGQPRFSFVGIEPLASSNGFAFVSLNDKLDLLAIGEGSSKDIFAYLAGQQASIVAIHAPAYLGSPHSKENQNFSSSPPASSYRACEFLLWQNKIPVIFTAATLKHLSAPARRGYQLFQTLLRFGFSFPNQSPANKVLIETCPAACYHQLANTIPLPEDAFFGRLQRQLILYNFHLPVQDPMAFFEEITAYKVLMGSVSLKTILLPEELNAMVIAYTAWMFHHQPEKTAVWGESSEGTIILPAQVTGV
jgi:hypothetical protein